METIDRAPIFKLYGEREQWPTPDMVHCETIASRSRLHDWHIQPHRHSGLYQILYLHQGHAIVRLDDTRHAVAGPAIVEVPQAFVHGFRFEPECVGYVITIAYPLLRRLSQELGPRASPLRQPSIRPAAPKHRVRTAPVIAPDGGAEDMDTLPQACARLNAHYRSTGPFRRMQTEASLMLLYALVRSRHHESSGRGRLQSRSQAHYARFSELLESSYTVHHHVRWYAAHMGMTPTHLTMVTRTHAGKTPLQLIHERLSLEASRSLVYSAMSISQISDALGFAEPAHFTRFFRRMVGEPPRAFRQRVWRISQKTHAVAPSRQDSAN